jgi:hypothetical protein
VPLAFSSQRSSRALQHSPKRQGTGPFECGPSSHLVVNYFLLFAVCVSAADPMASTETLAVSEACGKCDDKFLRLITFDFSVYKFFQLETPARGKWPAPDRSTQVCAGSVSFSFLAVPGGCGRKNQESRGSMTPTMTTTRMASHSRDHHLVGALHVCSGRSHSHRLRPDMSS